MLSNDEEFWAGLEELQGPVEKYREVANQQLQDLGDFLAQEEEILLKQKVPPAVVRKLLTNMSLTLTAFKETPPRAAPRAFATRARGCPRSDMRAGWFGNEFHTDCLGGARHYRPNPRRIWRRRSDCH
jgi:hypothetical protein